MLNKLNTQFKLLCVLILIVILSSTSFAVDCGDINDNGNINILDITYLIAYLYKQGPAPVDPLMADVNFSGSIDILDVTYLIRYLYKGGIFPICEAFQHLDNRGECNPYKGVDEDSSFVVFEVFGNDLRMTHMYAYYNCCLDYYVEYEIESGVITAYEFDNGHPCLCNCRFNLQTTLFNIPSGIYNICLIGIAGDSIGCETITIEDDNGMSEYDVGPCDMMESDKSLEFILYSLTGDTLNFGHSDAEFNCGAYFLIQFEQAGDTLRFFELNIATEYALCYCYFDISAIATGILPGDYVAEVWQQDIGEPEPILHDRQEIVLE